MKSVTNGLDRINIYIVPSGFRRQYRFFFARTPPPPVVKTARHVPKVAAAENHRVVYECMTNIPRAVRVAAVAAATIREHLL